MKVDKYVIFEEYASERNIVRNEKFEGSSKGGYDILKRSLIEKI